MLRARIRLSMGVVGCLFLMCAIPLAAQKQNHGQQDHPYHGKWVGDREVIVKFKTETPTEGWASLAAKYDLKSYKGLGGVRRLRHLRSRTKQVEELLQLLSLRPDVEYAEPNYELQAFEIPNDPGFVQLWGMQNTGQSYGYPAGTPGADISAVLAWDIFTGNTSYVIGIVDTGLDYTHPDLQPNVWSAPADFTLNIGGTPISCPQGSHGFNAIDWTCDPMDDNRHGTHVSGTIGAAGNNSVGVVGVNWTTQIMGLKFLNADGYGYVTDAINAIEFAVQIKQQANSPAVVRVLSNSWGGSGFTQALMDEIQAAADQDMLFVAAAGNSSANNDLSPAYPASYTVSNVISVAATDNNDALATFSNFGPNSVHLGAPGVEIFSTLPGGTYGLLSGTSMATPHVSGAAILVLSACDLSTPDVMAAILQNVDQIPSLSGMTITGGRLNLNKAIRSCSGPVSLLPHLLSFGRVQVGTTAGPKQLTLRNNQDVALNLSGMTSSDPQVTLANSCGTALTPRTNCQISVSFRPASVGDVSVSLQIADDGPGSPQTVTVTGTGSEDPDLAVASVVAPTKPIAPGASMTLSATVSDLGIFDATNTSITEFYLTSNGLKDSASMPLGQAATPAIPAGNSVTVSTTTTIPTSTPVGAYQIVACANDTNAFVEVSMANNCAATPVTVSLPDLIEASVAVTPTVTGAGHNLQITDTVTNQGNSDAGASVTQFYVSTGTTKGIPAQLLAGSRAIPVLAAGSSSTGTTTLALPSNLAAGAYYLLACADDTNVVLESNETNNCTSASVRLQVGPDLIETVVSMSPMVSGAGGTLQVTDTVLNQGGGDAAASVTQYYLSTSTSRTVSAQLLAGSRSVGAVAAGSSSTGTATVTLPAVVTPGGYYLLACADDTNLVAETNESNNCTAASSKLQLGPDLIESSVSATPTVTGAGGTVQVTDTVTNQGGGSAGASVTQYYLNSSSSMTVTAQRLSGSRSVPSLNAGANSSGGIAVTLPSTITPGSYYLLACADDTNLVAETNESNNCSSVTSKIQVGPDLIESAVSVTPTAASAGGTLQVTDTVTNQGGGNAAASVTQYYLNTSTSMNGNAQLLSGSRAVSALAAGGSLGGTVAVTLPAAIAPGSYYLLACADDTKVVAETNESNNCAAAATPVTVGPDLIETGVSASPTKVGAGGTLQIIETVVNQGAGSAGASVTQYYLSANTSKSSSSVLLSGSRGVAALNGGGSSAGATTVTLPANLPVGSYYLLACADDTNLVAEYNENNNCLAAPTVIAVGPDLVETAISFSPNTLGASGVLQITDTVANQGGGSAAASVTQFYLSTSTSNGSGAVLLTGSRAIPALNGGGNSSGTTSVNVSANLAVGSYYVLACADDTNLVAETNERNNCIVASSRLTLGPDLVETTVSITPTTAGAGGTLQISDTVANQGGVIAAASVTQFYLNTSTSKNGNAILLTGSRSIPALNGGATSSGTTIVTLPATLAVGSYYVLACADDTSLVAETNESNNCSNASYRVSVGPDLIESAVAVSPTSVGAGGSLQITDTVANQAGGSAAASVTQFYVNTSTSKNGNAILLTGSRSVPALNGGATSSGATTVTLPASLAVGSYYVLACADDTSVVPETNESNNCSAATARVSVGPDLIESAVSISPTSIALGGSFQITETVTNQGGGSAAASVTQFYLNTSTSKNGNAILLTGSRSVPALNGGASSSGTTAVTLPANLAVGIYYVLACADDTSVVPETNESNNCSAATARIQVASQ